MTTDSYYCQHCQTWVYPQQGDHTEDTCQEIKAFMDKLHAAFEAAGAVRIVLDD